MATIEGVGATYDFALNGLGLHIDTLDQESPFEYRAYTKVPIPLRLPRIDTSPEPGENSLGELWVRSQHDWRLGQGQEIFDC